MNARFLRKMAFAVVAAALLLTTATIAQGGPRDAGAHPLGNFTISRYARVELEDGYVRLRYVIDMAEIPAFQDIQAIDRDGNGVTDAEAQVYLSRRLPEIAKDLDLRVNNARIDLTASASELTFPEGQGGLRTLRLAADFMAAMPRGWQQGVRASFRDSNYADRVGWKEIVVRAGAGVALTASSVAAEDRSAELTAYPEGLLKSPLDVREASFAFEAGAATAAPRAQDSSTQKAAPALGKALPGFARLIERQRLTPAFVALSLLAAMAWGAAHALGPGHGKTIVGAYLVGSRGTARHALALGLTVTATHTSSVIALGLVTLYASRYVVAEDLYLWLSVASGLLVLLMGAALLWSRLRALRRGGSIWTLGQHHHDDGGHEGHAAGDAHDHDDHHAHDHDHDHLPARPGWRGLLMLGVSGGLLPCPTALVVMLGAIALDRVVYGLALIVVFSFGLAAVLTGIGILLVYAGRVLGGAGSLGGLARRFALPLRLFRIAPMASALMILVIGAALTGQAIAAL